MDGSRTPGFIGTAASIRDCGLSDAGQGNEEAPLGTGDCETCGYWSGDLKLGMCQPCRDKYGICEECE